MPQCSSSNSGVVVIVVVVRQALVAMGLSLKKKNVS